MFLEGYAYQEKKKTRLFFIYFNICDLDYELIQPLRHDVTHEHFLSRFESRIFLFVDCCPLKKKPFCLTIYPLLGQEQIDPCLSRSH